MDLEQINLLMETLTKENTGMANHTAEANTFGVTTLHMKESSKTA